MACNFIPVTSIKSCKEDFSGVSSSFYVFDGSNISSNNWNLDAVDYISDFETIVQTAIATQTLYEVQIKPKSGKVTATSNPNGGGFTNVYTAVVAKNMNDMAELARTLNNRNDWGILVPAGTGRYIVLYDKDFSCEFQMESDSGDAADSDHGHTVTITCGPMLYAMPKLELTIPASSTSLTATVSWANPSGKTVTANDRTADRTISSGSTVAVGHIIDFSCNEELRWPNGSVSRTYSAVVDPNGVSVSPTIPSQS